MKAVVLHQPVTAGELTVTDVPIPKVKSGWILVCIKAFGLNRSELYTRQGLSPSVTLPRVLGIECAGEVYDPSDSNLRKGQPVISMMGGLGREFDGSYAEYALIPATQVYPVNLGMDWVTLAALPEMYYTAWGSLVDTLHIRQTDTILIRGGTSAVGLAAIQIARTMGATVAATTRSAHKADLLRQYGADIVFTDDDTLQAQVRLTLPEGANKVLELVGTKTLYSSFSLLKQGGILCMSGILGNEWELSHFAPMDVIPSGSYFTIFDSHTVNLDSLHNMMDYLGNHNIQPPIAKVFKLEEIAEAHKLMERNVAGGKIIVVTE